MLCSSAHFVGSQLLQDFVLVEKMCETTSRAISGMYCTSVRTVGKFVSSVFLTGGQLPRYCRCGWSCPDPGST